MSLDAELAGRRRLTISPALLLTGLTILALALCYGRLGHWGFDSDEIFMLRDSLHPRLRNPRPLLYFLNHLLSSVIPLNEFGIRLLPAAFGVLAIPALYWTAIRLRLGTSTALFAAVLLTLSGLHVYYAQFGRYWSLVWLLTSIYPYAVYVGIRQRDRAALAIGAVAGVLAALAHPSSVLLVGGPLLWLGTIYLRPDRLRALWAQRRVRIAVGLVAVLLVAIALRFIPILKAWISSHDANPGSGQFLLPPKAPMGVKQAIYLLAFVQGLTPPIALTAVAGLYILWRERDRTLGTFLFSLAVFPMLFLMLAMVRTPVSTYYLVPTTTVYFLAAGVFLDRMAQMDWRLRPAWMVPGIILVLVLIPGIPTLVSQYLNGRRYDFKTTARWLEPSLTPHDIIYADQPVILAHYLPHADVQRLRFNTKPLEQAVAEAGRAGGALWIVAPAPDHAFRASLKEGGLARWMFDHCQMRNVVGQGRVDFRQQYLQVFRCPPAASAAETVAPAAAAADSAGG
jgi:hypothetical protein